METTVEKLAKETEHEDVTTTFVQDGYFVSVTVKKTKMEDEE